MQYKNYYETLHISPSSSADEIKKAFRHLALLHHPDVTNNDELKAERFRQIEEAYTVLSDTDRRRAYDATHFFSNKKNGPVTLESIMAQTNKLRKYLASMNHSKLNYDTIELEVENILSEQVINLLSRSSDYKTVESIVLGFNEIIFHLPYWTMQSYTNRLMVLAMGNAILQEQLLLNLQRKKKEMLWDKYKATLAIGIAVIICLLMVVLSRL